MGAFLIVVLIALVKVGVVLAVFGAGLYKIFEKSEVKGVVGWKAFVPYYNLLVWIKLTKNPWWFSILLLQWYILPFWWIFAIAAFILARLVLDSYHLYYKVEQKALISLITVLVAGIINFYLPLGSEIMWIVNALIAAAGLGVLVFLGTKELNFRKESYYSKEFSFSSYASSQFKKNKFAIYSLYILGTLIFIAVYSPYIANKQPWYVEYRGEVYFPAYQSIIDPATKIKTKNPDNGKMEDLQFDIADWKKMKLDNVVWAPIPYSPAEQDDINTDYTSPGQSQEYMTPDGFVKASPPIFRHHMGTDAIGRDVFSGLIHGSKVSLTVGIISMGIASFIGILLGAMAGFYGDNMYRASRMRVIFVFLGLLLGWFYGFTFRGDIVSEAFDKSIEAGFAQFGLNFVVFFAVLFGLTFCSRFLEFGWFKKKVAIPVDSIISRSIEVLNSIPRLLLIITIAAVVKDRSLILLMVIIGFTSWTGIARFTRAEFLRIRELDYIQAARALGYGDWRIIFKHALSNALAPVFVSIAFGIAAAILIESGLSFLGIGVPPEEITWGSLLSSGRQQFEAWWLVIFPGIAIFITITVYNLIGEGLRDALDPRLKQ
jgi:peptide/nickel transport system permease protein